jgi:site-specific recombinase XerD
MKTFSRDELQKLVHFSERGGIVGIWVKVLYSFGITFSELTEIKAKNVNLTKGTVLIMGKFHKTRILKIPECLTKDFEKLLRRKSPEDYIFSGRKGSVHPRTVQKAIEKITHSLGMYFSLRKLRNTLILDLFKNGWDDRSIATHLGHSTLKPTRKAIMTLNAGIKKSHPLDSWFKQDR